MDKITLKLFNKRFPITYCCEINVYQLLVQWLKAMQRGMPNVKAVLPLNY